jgi:hypothetical protein
VTESDFMRERRERTDAELAQMRDLQRACLVHLLRHRAFQLCLQAQVIASRQQRKRRRRAFG